MAYSRKINNLVIQVFAHTETANCRDPWGWTWDCCIESQWVPHHACHCNEQQDTAYALKRSSKKVDTEIGTCAVWNGYTV